MENQGRALQGSVAGIPSDGTIERIGSKAVVMFGDPLPPPPAQRPDFEQQRMFAERELTQIIRLQAAGPDPRAMQWGRERRMQNIRTQTGYKGRRTINRG